MFSCTLHSEKTHYMECECYNCKNCGKEHTGKMYPCSLYKRCHYIRCTCYTCKHCENEHTIQKYPCKLEKRCHYSVCNCYHCSICDEIHFTKKHFCNIKGQRCHYIPCNCPPCEICNRWHKTKEHTRLLWNGTLHKEICENIQIKQNITKVAESTNFIQHLPERIWTDKILPFI